MPEFTRRTFLGMAGAGAAVTLNGCSPGMGPTQHSVHPAAEDRAAGRGYNGLYAGPFLERIAFPMGGLGAGMICLEGSGSLSHMSLKHHMDLYNEPNMFASICIKGSPNIARVLEGPIPHSKMFWEPGTGNGAAGRSYGLPRFSDATFLARFPFATVTLADEAVPMLVEITGWSPFIPGDSDDSSLPVAALEYRLQNTSTGPVDAIFSYNTHRWRRDPERYFIGPVEGGFLRQWKGTEDRPWDHGELAIFTDHPGVVVNHNWFRGGWWDPLTLAWKSIERGELVGNPPVPDLCSGASLALPLTIPAGGEQTVRLLMAWYVPETNLRIGSQPFDPGGTEAGGQPAYKPWYAGRFGGIGEVSGYWRSQYDSLRERSSLFRDALYDTTLPPEVMEAVAANLTILKSPTVLRQEDGRLWCWEGCRDDAGCCAGSCTHVWNYAQAIPHLFPDLERGLRQTEFHEGQNEAGHQRFRAFLPIRIIDNEGHEGHAAADGQLGGIMKAHREWRISGDSAWLRNIWPHVQRSLDYCIETWDPRGRGVVEEPHHNTYDIEFWGPDGMCTGFYLGALSAAIAMAESLGSDAQKYRTLLDRGLQRLDGELFDGEYYVQKIQWEGLSAKYQSLDYSENGPGYREAVSRLNEEGPKYQYGTGCLSDVVLGFWMAQVCGVGALGDRDKIRSTLRSIHKYNLKQDLSTHANPQRPSFALGREGGLLLCTWPKGGALSLPFVYSDEVWTGIEYQVASHLMMEGLVEEGLQIVRTCRDRYSGVVRNPFNEYECGHWYARAMASYGLLQGLTGVRYDAVDKTLIIDSAIGGDFRSFLSTAGGFGTVGLDGGRPFLEMRSGKLEVRRCLVAGEDRTQDLLLRGSHL